MATNTSGEDLEKILELDPDDVVFGDSEEPEGYPELLPGEDDDGDELRGGGQVCAVAITWGQRTPRRDPSAPFATGARGRRGPRLLQDPDDEMGATEAAFVLRRQDGARA